MRPYYFLLLFLCLTNASAQSFNQPTCVAYDFLRDRYVVGCNSWFIYTFVPNAVPQRLSKTAQPNDFTIVGDSLYMCSGGSVYTINLATGFVVQKKSLPYAKALCHDGMGNLFAIDTTNNNIIRFNIAAGKYNTFVTLSRTPSDILYDESHNRIIVTTSGDSAQILSVNRQDSSVTVLQTTTLNGVNRINFSESHGYIIASNGTWSSGIYILDSLFAAPPSKFISFANGLKLGQPCYNPVDDVLAVPIGDENSVEFYPIKIITTAADYAALEIGSTKAICVLDNDSIESGATLSLQSVSTPQHGIATTNGNCIDYYSTSIGIDTISYLVCESGPTLECYTEFLYVVNIDSSTIGNHAPIAFDNFIITKQLAPIAINIGLNCVDSDNDQFCITSINGSPLFKTDSNNCHIIQYATDSFYTGNDTCVYVICDNGIPILCDTAMLTVEVQPNASLIPVADIYFFLTGLGIKCFNTSMGLPGTAVWAFYSFLDDSVKYKYGDTAYLQMCGYPGFVTLYISNPYGSDSIQSYHAANPCIYDAHVPDVRFNSFNLFPNPTNEYVSIELNAASRYTLLSVYDLMGGLVNTVPIDEANADMLVFNACHLSTGSYLILLDSEITGEKAIQKLFVLK